jgi:tetratricopeptide (TPR) repeat protein
MKIHFSSTKGLSPLFLVFFLLLTCGVFMGLKLKIDGITREKIPGASIIYIPSGKYLKFATFGNSSLLADLVYLWAIQYYSTFTIVDRYENLDHIFSIIAELDPRYLDPYDVGAVIAFHEADDLELALKILDKGLEKNPDQWIFPYEAGHYARIKKKYKLAQEYFKKAMEIEGAPDFVKRLYADATFMAADYKTSLETWMEIYQTAEDERIKKIASNHLYRTKSAIDIRTIRRAIIKFHEKFGRNPTDLSRLIRAGFLKSIPKDLDGKEYIYDPKTGKVGTPTIPWKR